ncbi:MAG: phage tail tape measure protein [Lachnospiraceae bacterium]|nr:phage tail tape measure protein [Lachnospiraceae bacterium]
MAQGKELKALVSISGKVDPALNKAISSASSSMKGFGDVAKTVSKVAAVAVTAIATGTIAAGKALIDVGNDFKAAQNTIRIGTGATGQDLQDLYGTMKEVYKSVPTTLEDASTVIADYNTRLGLTGTALQGLSTQALQVSKMLGEDVAGIVEESSQAFQQWHVSTENMGGAMDYIFKVSQSTGVGFTALMSDMQGYGAQLQDLGYSFEEAAALMGQLDKAGVNSGEVLKAMKKSVTTMAKEGKSASQGMKEYTDAIKNAGDATEATRIASEVFGARAASTMSAAIRNGTLDVEGLTAALKTSKETINSAAWDTYTFADKWQLVKQNLETAIEPLATSLVDALAGAMPYITQVVEDMAPKIEEWAANLGPRIQDFAENKLPTLVEGIGDAISWLVDNWDIITTVGPIIAGIALAVGPLSSAISGISGMVGGLSSGISSVSGSMASFGSSASGAASSAASASSSFSTLGGQALLLFAAGAAVLLIAAGMALLAQSAIALADAGPAAVAVFVLMAAVGIGVAAAIVAIGGAATISAVGLLALGAAVFLVGAGIAVAAMGAALFCEQLPTIAEYGLDAALGIVALSGAILVFSAALLLMGASLLVGTVAMAAFGATALVGTVGAIAFGGAMMMASIGSFAMLLALTGVMAVMEVIKNDAITAAGALLLMVTAVTTVQGALDTLKDLASSAVSSFLAVFESAVGTAQSDGAALGMGLTAGFTSGISGFMAAFFALRVMAAAQLAALQAQFANTKLELNRDIALPHFTLSGALDAQNNRVPNLDVKWYATGGFTDGLSIAGENGTEAVLSFDPAYRKQNISYWAKAGQMLGIDTSFIDLLAGKASSGGNTSISLGGITFSPNININGNASKEDVIAAIREEEPEFFDLLDRYIEMKGREAYGFNF